MAISDKVIELETVKKGRNIIFIVIIAVLAAASIIFGVLWAIKKPATDPPKVDSITVKAEDVFLAPDEAGTQVSKISIGNSYTFWYSVYLPSSATLDQINPLIEVVAEPSSWVTIPAPVIEKDEAIPNLVNYKYTVKVNSSATAGGKLRLIASSMYGEKITSITELVVDDQSTKFLQIDSVSLDKNSVNMPVSLNFKDNEYTIGNDLPRYSGALADQNLLSYYVNFSQLGDKGADGNYAKVPSGIRGSGDTYSDQVDVYVMTDGGEWEQVSIGNSNTSGLMVRIGTSDEYCRRQISFRSRKEGVSKIKFVANAFKSGATPIETILNLKFVDIAKMDKISQIEFRDPLTNKAVNSFDLYIGDATSAKPFVISDNIFVLKKGEWIKAEDDGALWKNNLVASIDSQKVFSVAKSMYGFSMRQTATTAGTAKINVRDTDTAGFGVSTEITVNLKSPITSPKIGASTSAVQEVGKGETKELTLSYDTRYAPEDANALNKALVFSYSSDLAKYEIPRFTSTGALDPSIKKQIIELEGLRQIKGESLLFAFDPTSLDSSSDKKIYTQKLKFNIGSLLSVGKYTFNFSLASQSALLSDPVVFSITFNVTDVANTVSVDYNYDFNSTTDPNVKFVIGTGGANNELYLPIRAGEATKFSLPDILIYRDANNNVIEGSKNNLSKFMNVSIKSLDNRDIKLEDIFAETTNQNSANYYKFNLAFASSTMQIKININLKNPAKPTEIMPNSNITLFVKFYKPVTALSVADNGEHLLSYNATGSGIATKSNTFDKLTRYTVGNVALTEQADLADKIYINVIIRPASGEYMLKKKDVGAITYYYDFNITAEDMIPANALFRYESGQLYILKDLFAYSLDKIGSGSFAYDNFRIMYSFEDITAANDGSFAPPTTVNTISGAYKAMRTYNKLEVYKSKNYDTVLSPREIASVSGNNFNVYVSGIIIYDGSKEFVVEGEKANNVKYSLLNIAQLPTPIISTGNNSNLTITHTGGTSFNGIYKDNGEANGTIKYKYNDLDYDIAVKIANQAVPIESITINELSNNTVNLYNVNNGGYGGTSAVIKFTVNFVAFDTKYFELENFKFSTTGDLIVEEYNGSFNKALPEDIISGTKHVYNGQLKVSLNSTPVGESLVKITSLSTGIEAQFKVVVHSPADYVQTTFGSAVYRSAGYDDTATDGILQLEIKGTETATLVNDFVTKGTFTVDMNKFAFSYVFSGTAANNLQFVSQSKTGCTIKALGRVLSTDNTFLTMTFTETISGYADKVHIIKIRIVVDVPVYLVKAEVEGNDTSTGNLNIALTGTADWQTFELNSIINNGTANQAPTDNLIVEFKLTDASGNTITGKDEQIKLVNNGNNSYLLMVNNAYKFWLESYSYKLVALAYTGTDSDVAITSNIINIAFTSKQYTLSFNNSALANNPTTKVYDYTAINFAAKLVNVANPDITITNPAITYDITNTGLTAALSGSTATISAGNKGSYTVTASYTNTDNGGEVYTISHTVNFYALVNGVTVVDNTNNTEIPFTGSKLLKDKTYTFKVGLTSSKSNDKTPYSDVFTIENQKNITVTKNGNILTVTPTGGAASFDIVAANGEKADSKFTKQLTFNTDAPTITLAPARNYLELNSDIYNVLTFTAKLSVDGYTPTFTHTIAGDTKGIFKIKQDATDAKTFKIFVDTSKYPLTADDFKQYTLKTTATVDGVDITASEFKFEFKITVAPTFKIVNNNNSDIVNNVLDLKTHTTEKYKVSTSGYDLFTDNVAVTYSPNLTVNANGEITSTLTAGTSMIVFANVTIFGKTFKTAEHTYIIRDSSTIAVQLYGNSANNFITDGSGNYTDTKFNVGQSYAIDYETTGYYIAVIIDYSSAPVVGAVSPTNFSVAFSRSGVSLIANSDSVDMPKHKYYAKFLVTSDGALSFTTTLNANGFSYTTLPYAVTLTSFAPAITASSSSAAINPGGTSDIDVSIATNGFKGTLTHAFSIDVGSELATLTKYSDTKYKLGANLNTNGGKVTVKVVSTVTSGIYNGKVYTNYVDVTINKFDRPTVKIVKSAILLPGEATTSLADYYTVAFDANDSGAAYSATYLNINEFGTINNGIFTAKAGVNAKTFVIKATVKIDSGYFKGDTITTDIPFVILPTVTTTATIDNAKADLLPLETATLSVSITGSVNASDYTVKYTVADSSYGYMSGDKFVANQKNGSTTVTATVTIINGKFASGKALTATTTVTVRAIMLKDGQTLSVAPGESKVLDMFTQYDNAAQFTIRDLSDYAEYFTLGADNRTLIVKPNINYTGATKVFKLHITCVTSSSPRVTHAGFIDLTITSETLPTLTLTAKLNNDKVIDLASAISISQGDEINIAISSTSGNVSDISVTSPVSVGKIVVDSSNATAVFTAVDATESVFNLTVRATVHGMVISQTINNISITAKSTTDLKANLSSADVAIASGQTLTINLSTELTDRYIYSLSFGVSSIYNYVYGITVKSGANSWYYYPNNTSQSGTSFSANSTLNSNRFSKGEAVSILLTMHPSTSYSSTNINLPISAYMVYNSGYNYAPSAVTTASFKINKNAPSAVTLTADTLAARAGSSINFTSMLSNSDYIVTSRTYSSSNPDIEVTSNGVAKLKNSAITSITTATITATLTTGTYSGLTSTKVISFVPKNSIMLAAKEASGFINAGKYTFSLKNALSGVTVEYYINGTKVVTPDNSNDFAPGIYDLEARYTVNNSSFTESASVTVLAAPNITVSKEVLADKTVYTVASNTISEYNCIVQPAYVGFISVTKTVTNNIATFTVTRIADKFSATDIDIMLEFSAKVTSGIYQDVVSKATDTFAFAKTAPQALELTDNGTAITANYNSSQGTVQYVVTSGFNYVQSLDNATGAYVLIAQKTEQTVTVKALFTFTSGIHNGVTLTKEITLTVPTIAKPTLSAVYDVDTKQITATTTGSGVVTYLSNNTDYVEVNSSGLVTKDTYTSSTEAATKDITVTVTYTITIGVYAGETVTTTVTVTATNQYTAPEQLAFNTQTPGTTGTITITNDYVSQGTVQYVVTSGFNYVQTLDNATGAYVLIAQKTEQTVTVKALFTFTSGIHNGVTLTKEITLTVPTITKPTLSAVYDVDTKQITATTTGVGVVTYLSNNTDYVEVNSSGLVTKNTYTSSTEAATKDITVTVTYTITSGVYAGETVTTTVTVTATNTYEAPVEYSVIVADNKFSATTNKIGSTVYMSENSEIVQIDANGNITKAEYVSNDGSINKVVKVMVVFTITDGNYSGTTVVKYVDVTATNKYQAPEQLAFNTQTPGATGTISITNDYISNGTMQYVVTSGQQYITSFNAATGEYVLIEQATDDKKVLIMALFTFDSGIHKGITLIGNTELNVPKEAAATLSARRVQTTDPDTSVITDKIEVLANKTGEYTFTSGNDLIIGVDTDGNLTVNVYNDAAYNFATIDVIITVSQAINTGAYKDTTITCTVTITVENTGYVPSTGGDEII